MCIYLEFAVNVSLQAGETEKLFELCGGCLHLTESIPDSVCHWRGRHFRGAQISLCVTLEASGADTCWYFSLALGEANLNAYCLRRMRPINSLSNSHIHKQLSANSW